MINRLQTKKVMIKNIQIGHQNKIVIQSMTNTKTSHIKKTIKQINQLYNEGAEIIRVSLFDKNDVQALKKITTISPCPIIADVHYNYKFAIDAIKNGAAKIRLNPGNIANKKEIIDIINVAKEYKVAIRIGVNSGSLPSRILKKYGLTAKAMIKTLDQYLKIFIEQHFDNIIISLKATDPLLTIDSYLLAAKKYSYPLHIGVTEAGIFINGIITSVSGLAPIIHKNIGDTIRVSLTGNPVNEVIVCKKLLNSFNLYDNFVSIISCPTCGRLNFNLTPLVKQIEEYVSNFSFPLKIAVLGCAVNGIGEAGHADIAVVGSFNSGLIYVDQKFLKKVSQDNLFNEIVKIIDIKYHEFNKYVK